MLLNPWFLTSGMRTKINKKRGRPSEHSEEAQAKKVKRGKNSWGFGVGWGGGVCMCVHCLGERGGGP